MKKIISRFLMTTLLVNLFTNLSGVKATVNEEYENIAMNKPIVATATEGKYEAKYANDGNESTYWAGVNPSEIQIDLQGVYNIKEINLMAYFKPTPGGAVERAYDYEIYASKTTALDDYIKIAEKNSGELETSEGNIHLVEDIEARYIKVKMLNIHAVGQPTNKTGHIKELRVYGDLIEDTKSNIALNKTAYASSHEGNYTASKAIDGNKSTYWAGPSSPMNLEVDLEGYFDISEINLTSFYGDGRVYNYQIYGSSDNATYKLLCEKRTNTPETADGTNFTFDKETVRYIKVKMLSNSANPSVHIQELEVFGTENTDFVPPEEPVDNEPISFGKPTRSYSDDERTPTEAINDGKLSTDWRARYYPQYIDIDLEKNYNISKLNVIPSINDEDVFYQYSIYGSLDGANFTLIQDKQSKDLATIEGDIFEFTDVEARIIRVYLENVSKGNTGGFSEVKVYGNESETDVLARPEVTVPSYEETNYNLPISTEESLNAVKGVVSRTIGEKYLDWFEFVLEDNPNSNEDYYEISNSNGKIRIKGNEGIALTTGLNYYLKYYCNIHISQQARQVTMPEAIVPVDKIILKESPYDVRYAYNYCTHSYTMAFWGETEWQNELDWLSLNGINSILDITGQEEVWRRFLGKLGYSLDEIKDWLVGPGYFGWQFMNNMENINGPIPDNWFADRTELARKNQRQMRALGITPILQGYSGMVPVDISKKDKDVEIIPQGLWNGMQRPAMLKTTSKSFIDYSKLFYESQEEVYGNVSNMYATDPFHEGGITGGIERDVVGRIVLDEMKKYDNDAVWVIQSWSFRPELLAKITAEEKLNNILLLDLNGTRGPRYSSTNEFSNSSWVYCMLENYGGRSGISGNLEKYTKIPSTIKNKTNHMVGIGIAPEGTNNNPIKYDLFFEMMWEKEDVDLKTWLKNYVNRRYGKENIYAQKAWEIMLETAYLNTDNSAQPPETIFNCRPRFDVNQSAPNGNASIHYNKIKFEGVIENMIKAYPSLKENEGFLYDFTDFTRQALSNSAQEYYKEFTSAYKNNEKEKFKEKSQDFLNMIDLQEKILNTNKHFMVGTWLEPSVNVANKEDDFSEKILKLNSKALISSWAPYYCWGVYDYGNREYAGITEDYYKVRWVQWIDRLTRRIDGDTSVSIDYSVNEGQQLAWEWARSDKEYPTEASGNINDLAKEVLSKYSLKNTVTDSSNLPQDRIKATTPLQEYGANYKLSNTLDGNTSSIWATKTPSLEPFEVYFEFDNEYEINGFTYLPRPGGGNGNILGVEIYSSNDGSQYNLIKTDNYAKDATLKTSKFDNVKTKYIKLVITNVHIWNDLMQNKSVSAAEFNFMLVPSDISSTVYRINDSKINGVSENTKVSSLLANLTVKQGELIVLRGESELSQNDIILEGDLVQLTVNGDIKETLTIADLIKPTDFTKLNDLISQCEKLDEKLYTPASWKNYSSKLTIAIGVQVNPEATQEEVDLAALDLEKAIDALESIVNKEALISLIKYSEVEKAKLEYINIEDAKKDIFEIALINAIKIRDDKTANEATVDKGYNDLINGLRELSSNKVTNLSVIDKTNTTVKLGWEKPEIGVEVAEYIIYKDGQIHETIKASDALEYEITGLRSNTIYGFKVVAKDIEGGLGNPKSINIRTSK